MTLIDIDNEIQNIKVIKKDWLLDVLIINILVMWSKEVSVHII